MSEETRICDDSVESEEGDAEPFLEDSDNSRELLERLRELEAENSSLALANESQREAYERCLDEVANHVVQALLNQKDLREECIKLKMRVFDLERQNRALAELLTQTLHGQVSTQQQASPGPQLEPCPDSLLTGLDRPSESQHETPTKSQSTDSTLGTQGATISMEALSPFFKKRAHILEVLRCLEETDPLKFHPSAGLPSCCRFSPVLLPAEPGVASHACMDSDVLAVMNSEGHRVPCESCQSCLLVSQRNLHIASKFHQANSAWQPNAEGQLGDHGASSSQTIQPPPGSTNKPCTALAEESDLSIDHRYENAGDPSHGINTGAYLYSIIKDVAQNFPSSERSEQLKGGAPHVEGHCEKLSGVTLGMQCTPQPSEMDSLPLKHMNTAAIQSLTAGHIPDRCCFKMASEVAKMKTCLYTSTSYQTDHQARLQICSGLHQSSSVDTRLKNMIVDACGPSPGNSTVSSPGKIGLALTPTSISYLSEGKASPISSPSRLLSFLKIPSMGERVQVASPLRLSPQLTRSSKIPCRNNNYEICHSALVAQRAPGTEREMPSSSSKTNTYPAAHSAPASPPKADDVCSSVAKNFAFNSLSAPKGSCDAKLKPAQGNIQKDPRYENIAGLSALGYVEGPSQHLQVPPYPGQASEKPLSSVKDTFPSTGSSPGLESSIQDTYAESTVWYQVQGHHSLPNSSVFHKSQSSCVFSSVKEKTPDRETVQSPSVGPARVRPKRGHLPATSKKHAVGQCQGEAGHLPFKERLAALGKLRIADDLPAATRHVDRRHARCSNIKAAGPCTNEKSRTAERQADRTSSEHRHTKYTGSLDGKSYPRASPSGCALKSLGPCLPCEPGAKSLSLNSASSRPVLETFSSRVHMTEGSKIRPGMMPSNTEAPHMKTTAFHGVPLTARTAASSQSSPAKVSSKSPSRPGQASSCPRGCKPAHDDRGSSQRQPPRLEDRGRLTGGKKKNPPLPARPPDLSEDRRPFVPGSRSAIEQKVMKGIEENMLKLQDQSRGQSVELKQKASNGIASWFGLRKSKLPALSRKADMSKSKEDKKEWKLNVSAPGKDPKSATKKKLEVESLNISKLMEKAEDLRRALEEERAFMNGVALERPVRGHSCEVGRDQAQGQLSVMYRGVSPDNFMQQLLNRVDERGAGPFGLAHRRLSFDSKRSRPVFSHQRKDGIPHTKSSEDMEKGSDMVRKSEVTSDESLAEFVTSQRFAGSGATHTLDSGIGTFPLPMLEISRQKPRPEGDTPACSGRPGTKVSRKARTLDRALSSLEEAPHRDSMPALCGSALEESASTAALSSTIAGDVASLPSKNWTFPNLKAPVGQAEVFLDIREEVELAVSEGVELGVSEWVELGVSEGVELTTHGSPLRQV